MAEPDPGHSPHPDAVHVRAQLAALDADPQVSAADVASARSALEQGDLADAVRRLRRLHATSAVERAVGEGRLDRAAADEVLQRLGTGEDPHALRRELQRLGITLSRRPSAGDDA